MRFTLEIDLPEEEIDYDGINVVLPRYLDRVAERIACGNADAGTVYDDNGSPLGKWRTTD